MLEVYILMV